MQTNEPVTSQFADFVDRKGLAERLGYCPATIARCEKLGLPVTRVGRSIPLYKVSSVRQWLESHEQRKASQQKEGDPSLSL